MKNSTRPATIAAILANSVFGFSFMFSRIALNYAQPFVMLSYRFIITAVILLIIALFSSGKSRSANDGEIDWLRFDLRGRGILPLIGLGLVQPVGYFLCESYGIALTNATVSGVIIALVPIAGIAAGILFLREYPTRKQIIYSILSILAVAFLTLLQSEGGNVRPLGIVLLFGAVLSGTGFNAMSRKLSGKYSVLERTVLMMITAAIVFTGLAVIQCREELSQLIEPAKHPQFFLSIAYLSICSSVVAFMALNFANNRLPIAKTTAFANLTTVISLFAGALFLGEIFNIYTLIASAMIIFCISKVQKS